MKPTTHHVPVTATTPPAGGLRSACMQDRGQQPTNSRLTNVQVCFHFFPLKYVYQFVIFTKVFVA